MYGANTDVGKTIFSTILCKGAKRLRPNEEVAFLKPISTGPDDESDQRCKSDHSVAVLAVRAVILTTVTDGADLADSGHRTYREGYLTRDF